MVYYSGMPNFNPFNNDTEDTSFERGSPVSQAAKNISQAAQKQADDAIKKANDEIIAELYGSSTPAVQDQGTDEANTQHTDASNAATRMASTHAGVSKTAKVNPNQTPEEQAKMEKIRKELFGTYSAKYLSAQNGAQNIITNVEMEMDKARQERKQEEEQRKQEEEQEEQRKKEEEEKAKKEFLSPLGKNAGRNRMGEPVALRIAKTKTEINRGTTG